MADSDAQQSQIIVNVRKIPRRHLIYYLRVFDGDSGEQIGSLVDITAEGVMLVGEKAFEPERIYHCRMALPDGVFANPYLQFDARCIWTRRDVNTIFFDGGFKLLEMDEDKTIYIDYLINVLGFRD